MPEAARDTDLMDNKSEVTTSPNPTGNRKKMPRKLALQKRPPPEQYDDYEEDEGTMSEPTKTMAALNRGSKRIVPVHQSRIRDRPQKPAEKDSSLKIKIELDLEVEVEIYARVKGDVTIGLM